MSKKRFLIFGTLMFILISAFIMSAFLVHKRGDFKGEPEVLFQYKSSEITKPKKLLKSQAEIINAINYNILNFKNEFTLEVQDYAISKVPIKSEAYEFYFLQDISYEVKSQSNNISKLAFFVQYNEAGLIVQNKCYGTAITKTKRVNALESKCEKILEKSAKMSDYEKIVYFHDYIVENTDYEGMGRLTTAYNVLIGKSGESDGYTEAYQLLLTLSGIKNRRVYCVSDTDAQPHYFNKVFLDGKWYNVDLLVDDPRPSHVSYKNAPVRTYLLVTDSVSRQRYQWETKRYPKSVTKNNWHMRNNLVAKNQDELEQLVDKAIDERQKSISVWVDDYNYVEKNYTIGFAEKNQYVKECKVSYITPGLKTEKENDTCATALYFEFTYQE